MLETIEIFGINQQLTPPSLQKLLKLGLDLCHDMLSYNGLKSASVSITTQGTSNCGRNTNIMRTKGDTIKST
jgi:hypothetical protein